VTLEKNLKMKKYILILLSIILLSSGFVQAQKMKKKLRKTNLVSMYDERKFTDFEAVIYHTSEKISTVYINIHLNDLNYLHHKTKDAQLARFKVSYELFDSYEAKTAIDTNSIFLTDTQNYGNEIDMLVDFDVKAVFPGDYILKIQLTDLNMQESNSIFNFYEIFKSDKNTAQFFLVTDTDDFPIFRSSIKPDQYFKIQSDLVDSSQLYIRYYNRKLPLAQTPFANVKEFTFKFDPDSLYSVTFANGKSELLELPFHGIYHFQADISQVEGLTLFRFDDGFPEIETPLQAILPLRYLTTKREYDLMLNYEDHKMAVDSFWLQRASFQEARAVNMISKYYQRVQDANNFFSSYQEGWKTDRGIVYIIYGPPSEVYLKAEEEEWIYGERGNPMSIKFYFHKVENPFSSNDYRLQRSSIYKTSWYVAIENWRR